MEYYELPVDDHLKKYIKCFWVLKCGNEGIPKDYMLPSGLGYIFHMRTSESFKATYPESNDTVKIENGFYCTYLTSLLEFERKEMLVIGAAIYPVHLGLIFKGGLDQIKSKTKKVHELYNIDISDKSEIDIVQIIGDHIIHQLNINPIKKDLSLIYKKMIETKYENISVKEVASWLGCSERHLNTLFRNHIGMGAKRLIQLMRFNHTIELLEKPEAKDNLAAVAHQVGYYDQSHFIKEIKAISGKTPSELLLDKESISKKFKLY
ncbi:helix-turn-helix domain-containing protein [Flagellimonas meridianipacifica]|uniref:AraC-like DNA-binding protein n=1 Tax=Flagellimonas meridianipacifica TaxID=1080225 RepID=A0A2T0MJC0_9FLAO|nr:response regulator transcription factor [Allomuricauda pacifica]PRX57690.1 AraC-like DNA-binding protein [Allomuricauda pacifica]